jgi:hypothetical protein
MPADLKQRVSAWLARKRATGSTVAELASEIGLAAGTVLRWSAEAPTRAIVPVRVIADRAEPRAVSVISPTGFRIDGITLAEAAWLLRELG